MSAQHGSTEVRLDPDGKLDEFIAHGAQVHLEQLGDGEWWIGIVAGEEQWHLNLWGCKHLQLEEDKSGGRYYAVKMRK